MLSPGRFYVWYIKTRHGQTGRCSSESHLETFFFFVTQGPFSLIHLQRNIWKLIMDSHSAAEEQSNLGASDNFLTKPNGEEHSVEDIRDAEIKGKKHYCRPQEQ